MSGCVAPPQTGLTSQISNTQFAPRSLSTGPAAPCPSAAAYRTMYSTMTARSPNARSAPLPYRRWRPGLGSIFGTSAPDQGPSASSGCSGTQPTAPPQSNTTAKGQPASAITPTLWGRTACSYLRALRLNFSAAREDVFKEWDELKRFDVVFLCRGCLFISCFVSVLFFFSLLRLNQLIYFSFHL